MTTGVIPDSSFGERVRRRLAGERVIWLTTVGADGTPQPNPVWFLWEGGDSVLIYNRANARRLVHLRRGPHVSLHFNTSETGGDVVVFKGEAEILDGHRLAGGVPGYIDKYRDRIADWGVEGFEKDYPIALRVRFTGLRGF
ncbi:TIGR03667 family PPOX class F420-dependent oxidoreductase [Nonomuraea basaltis]|uniref:TIGR03667 family PPOX class F420-dependent oxidoreductase n=1 Tax=Nonomuraea basaltis TaxID=2495887 RepID=UPI00110C6504|nr:TIGR03667 family PPOX class F420-dependent oxidoreductase [Nonomuraea basaltis]TMR94404.1 TIGR03667 family PPOX class F420-dependent oxidoreductase [Nonomuraea basaltis]